MSKLADLESLAPEMTEWRRHLHRHPELAYEEHATAAFVADKLRSFGVDDVVEGVGGTGVVATIFGRKGGANAGGSLALRADMDALPINETTGVEHASTVPGKMHACGHDGHTAMLLGAAKRLAETRGFAGTVRLIFQPAEEGHAGAKAMLDDGLLERFPFERAFGLHNWPYLPPGRFAMRSGPAMASADTFKITLSGQGSHAGMPHTGRDPVLAGCQLVQALQSVISRETDPAESAVLSVTMFHAGAAPNVVPGVAEIGGTVRAFSAATRDRIERRLNEVSAGIAAAAGIESSVAYRRGYPPTVNEPEQAAKGAAAAAALVGEEAVERSPSPATVAEDFAYILERVPGAYVWMGVGGAEEGKLLHSPFYDFNDDALAVGAAWWVTLVERELAA